MPTSAIQVFVFTGFRDEVLAARIQNAGGAIRSGISRSVTTLLTADASAAPSGKVRKALEYGIAVRRKADFEREFYIAKDTERGDVQPRSVSASSSWIPSRVRPRLERREGGAAAGLRPADNQARRSLRGRRAPWRSVSAEPPRQLDVEDVEVDVADPLEELVGPGLGQGLGQSVARGRRRVGLDAALRTVLGQVARRAVAMATASPFPACDLFVSAAAVR